MFDAIQIVMLRMHASRMVASTTPSEKGPVQDGQQRFDSQFIVTHRHLSIPDMMFKRQVQPNNLSRYRYCWVLLSVVSCCLDSPLSEQTVIPPQGSTTTKKGPPRRPKKSSRKCTIIWTNGQGTRIAPGAERVNGQTTIREKTRRYCLFVHVKHGELRTRTMLSRKWWIWTGLNLACGRAERTPVSGGNRIPHTLCHTRITLSDQLTRECRPRSAQS